MRTIYENNIIRLRDATLEDAGELLELTKDIDVMRYYGMNSYKDIKEAEDEINWFKGLLEENKGVRWVIADKDSDKYVGDIGVFNLDTNHNRIEIGFKLKKDYWNRGIMSECIKKVLEFGFVEKGYNRIEALVDTRNTACGRVLKNNGFKLDGVLREYEFEHGNYVDLEMYSILKREYKGSV